MRRPMEENTEDIVEEDGNYQDYEDRDYGDDGDEEDYEDEDDWSLPEAEEGDDAAGGKKNKICPHCQKECASPYHLERHIRTHTKQRPFSCELCSQKFSRKEHLKRHVDTVHLDKRPHICPDCNETFGRSYHLKRHMKNQHQK